MIERRYKVDVFTTIVWGTVVIVMTGSALTVVGGVAWLARYSQAGTVVTYGLTCLALGLLLFFTALVIGLVDIHRKERTPDPVDAEWAAIMAAVEEGNHDGD